jgi:hypothetical protein
MPRACGPCTACCTIPKITPLAKERYEDCRRLRPSARGALVDPSQPACSDYEKRPDTCRAFLCGWRVDERVMLDEERPDLCGVMLAGASTDTPFYRATGITLVVASEVWPGAFEEFQGRKPLKRLAKKYLIGLSAHGEQGEVRRFIGPPHLRAQVAKLDPKADTRSF